MRRRRGRRLGVLVALLLLTPLLTVTVGPAGVPLGDVVGVIANHVPGLHVTATWSPTVEAIVWQTRVPRIIGAIAIGAILGIAGVVFQAIVRNSLAEPYVLGVSAGASFGAAVAMIVVGTITPWGVGACAFVGALLATVLVLGAGGRHGSPLRLILGGLGIGFGFQAATNLLVFSSSSPETARTVLFWTLGSLARVTWGSLPMLVVVALGMIVLFVFAGPVLDALASGDRTAQSVGIEPATARMLLLIPASLGVAVAVAAAGGIGFVGLIVPHLLRAVFGHGHRLLVLATAVGAALFLVWADAVARIAFAPIELPIGVMTGLVGAPLLVVLVRRLPTHV
ncbi:iron ABC transporter permease [uncultured Tessaracoccus sp.]|uniref:FecCD family ABC transporter permease n=1 Tax=uncultured Tessaracoccus sp. TaxID=905023 RepID=UPI0025FA870A|nr:iron ABC transporter permease [uncultured Tessaracoccus sp.]